MGTRGSAGSRCCASRETTPRSSRAPRCREYRLRLGDGRGKRASWSYFSAACFRRVTPASSSAVGSLSAGRALSRFSSVRARDGTRAQVRRGGRGVDGKRRHRRRVRRRRRAAVQRTGRVASGAARGREDTKRRSWSALPRGAGASLGSDDDDVDDDDEKTRRAGLGRSPSTTRAQRASRVAATCSRAARSTGASPCGASSRPARLSARTASHTHTRARARVLSRRRGGKGRDFLGAERVGGIKFPVLARKSESMLLGRHRSRRGAGTWTS